MKNYFLIFAGVLMVASCTTKQPHITFSGNVPGLNDGTFLVTDSAGQNLAGQNITNGTFKIDTILENKGYGSFTLQKNGEKAAPVEVYLEPGQYTIEASVKHLDQYPNIKSSSAIQNDLTAYYTTQEKIIEKKMNSVFGIREKLDMDKLKLEAFQSFIKQHPDSKAAAHLMLGLNYEKDAEAYSAIYSKLNTDVKNTEEGKFIGNKLGVMMKLLPGATGPGIAGKTPDGKAFDQSQLNKRVYVVEFWKAGNQVSRLNHQDMIKSLLKNVDVSKVGFISISMDTKREWWTKAIADDKLSWPQYSDLKGDDSADAERWAITKVPTYYILNGKWQIVQRDVDFGKLEATINDYLSKR
ncbi:hypothetical protein [Mucilaginibacter sp. CSA2-8R]|uniref:TlpA family protein disulfide reductase n=1 Tax=Mucilaginibacter sp. CSA2-8R TaxID=3141542 RepID=UPI00315DA1C1